MAKYKYIREFEFNASKKMLFPYLSTASGLAQWFAEDVNVDNEAKIYTFMWDGDTIKAKLVSNRINHHVRFEVLDEDDPNYFEFKIDVNELTQSVYVQITDYSDMDEQEASELWESLIRDLRGIVGG